MRSAVCVLTVFATGVAAAGQNNSGAQTTSSGVTAEWDVRAYMAAMAADIRRLEPALNSASPAEWVSKGAPDTYVRQLQSSQASMKNLVAATEKLAREPERLSTAMDAYFQMERMELLVSSLLDGIRKYQSPELADDMTRAFSENMVHRDRLRQHIRDLATTREQEYEIVNQEAQRCRGMLSRQAAPEPKPPTRRKK